MTLIDQGALVALSISFLWALTSILSAGPARKLGGMRYNRLRISIVAVVWTAIAGFIVWRTGVFPSVTQLGVLTVSGFDSSGCAGLQMDNRVIHAVGAMPLNVPTAWTLQTPNVMQIF